MSGCFSLHAVISWKLPHAHSKRSDNCSFPVNIAFSISSLDILIASVAVFPKFCYHCDWGTPVCGQFCLKRLRCPLNEDCELKASELMNVSLLPEWSCPFRNKKVIPTSLREPKFFLKNIYLNLSRFWICCLFFKKILLQSQKTALFWRLFFRCHGNQFKATKFSRLKRKREHSVPPSRSSFQMYKLFFRPGYTATRSYDSSEVASSCKFWWFMVKMRLYC